MSKLITINQISAVIQTVADLKGLLSMVPDKSILIDDLRIYNERPKRTVIDLTSGELRCSEEEYKITPIEHDFEFVMSYDLTVETLLSMLAPIDENTRIASIRLKGSSNAVGIDVYEEGLVICD